MFPAILLHAPEPTEAPVPPPPPPDSPSVPPIEEERGPQYPVREPGSGGPPERVWGPSRA